ncbi:MAG TPA: hypothetical protein PKI11_03535 [Candidatus Hydrogenedentes bacterium]|nr:hypothetical protein [Candidatus Hydrogenedentota bacterium]
MARTGRKREKEARRASLFGWIVWAPLFAAPFTVAFYEVWLNTQTWRNDYKLIEISAEMKRLEERLHTLRVEEARLLPLEYLETRAPHLGLVEPQPSQIETIYVDPRFDLQYGDTPQFELARGASAAGGGRPPLLDASAARAPTAPARPPAAPWLLDESPENQLGSF